MDTTNLISWLPFDSSTTQDLCDNEWTVTGSPTIEDNALKLNGSSYLKRTEKFIFTGQPFTISCKFSGTSNTTGGAVGLWQMYIGEKNRFQISILPNGTIELWKDADSTINIDTSSSVLDGQIHHAECDFDGATWYFFIDGNLIGSKAHTCSARNYTLYVGANYSTGRKFTGTIDEFQLYDGVALHTENFTPPTEEDYFRDKMTFGSSANFNFTADVERRVKNLVEVIADVQRAIKTKWRYTNAGDADDLIIASTVLTDLPETQSRTGTGFYQTTRAKCFDLPTTDEVWMKFDVYFNGSQRWRAYNDGSNGTTGITAQTDGEITYFVNGKEVHAATNAAKKNQLQTVILHMISDSSAGVIEAWVDGNFIYRYTGDVNHGQDFTDIYLQSDGAGTFFSNVIISNYEIGLDEGFQIFSADVERRIKNRVEVSADVQRIILLPIVVPLIGDHFNHYVQSLTLFRDAPQRIILPKNSVAYIRATGNGSIKVFSDTDNTGKVTSAMHAELDECNSIFIQSVYSQHDVIKAFMYSLGETTLSGDAALDEAINYCTGGAVPDKDTLVNNFIRDRWAADSYNDFLKNYCGIQLSNADTGAITGKDAGGDITKTAQSIVPEPVPVEDWVIPRRGSSVTIDGLTVLFPAVGADGSTLTDLETHILAGLNSVWIEQSLKLIKESFGFDFNSEGASVNSIRVKFINEISDVLASVQPTYQNGKAVSLELLINMYYYRYITATSEDGATGGLGYLYFDRTIAHELTHAVMAANINNFSSLPKYIVEGMAEIVHGIDDLRGGTIINLLTKNHSSVRAEIQKYNGTANENTYAVGYMLLRYLAKQGVSEALVPETLVISDLLISDGATDSDYNALTDNTRQIFYPDVLRTLFKQISPAIDVEILDVVTVEFLADLKRALLARLILFPRNSEDFFQPTQGQGDNPSQGGGTSQSGGGGSSSGTIPPNTSGLQSFEVTIAEQQVTDQVKFTGIIPFDIMQQVSGQYFDYIYDMRVERVQQQGILYSCDCCSDIDKLLYTQMSYKIPPTTWYYKVDGEIVGESKTVEVETHYPPASEHVNRIANALGLSPVMQFDNYQTTVLTDDLGGVTYNDLIRDVFGWTSRVPTQLINVYIREGKLFVIERGHESHSVDISAADKTLPIITKELVRTAWGSSITSTTTTNEANVPYFVPADKVIDTGGDTSGGEEEESSGYRLDPDDPDLDEPVKDAKTEIDGLDIEGYTTYSYNERGLLRKVKSHTEQKSTGNTTDTTVHHSYDEDGTMIETITKTTSKEYDERGNSTTTKTKSIDKKVYVILANGEKFLASEYSAKYEDDELVDEQIVTHSPTRVGQSHTVAVSSNGIIGEVSGQNTGDDRVTPFGNSKALELKKEWDSKKWDEETGTWREWDTETGTWKTHNHEWSTTVYGLSLYDSSFPIHNEDKLIRVTKSLKDLNRKTRETVNVSIYDFEHLIDFNDRIILDGAEYFLVSNTARTTPRIKFEQNLTLVRWY